MNIKYLGHAGFLVESKETILLMDPWLSPDGAFCKSWYQYPNNHFLFDEIDEIFSNSNKKRYIYISHEHRDHFDIDFLSQLSNKDFIFIIPKYRSSALIDGINKIKCKKIIECIDSQKLKLNDLSTQLLIDDTGINRDSAIIVSDNKSTFLNMNDCKVYERFKEIKSISPHIDIAAIQFSGATWYPICYNLDSKTKNKLMLDKKNNKFNLVLNFLNKIKPQNYIPSAGPPCFLANDLKYINFIHPSQFPQKEEFIDFLKISKAKTNTLSMDPGDVYVLEENKLVNSNNVKSNNLSEYIAEHSKNHYEDFDKKNIDIKKVLNNLIIENLKKIKVFQDIELREPYCLYYTIIGYSDRVVKVDLNNKKVKLVSGGIFDKEEAYYKISAPAWLYEKVLDGDISWSDFSLTFRLEIDRKPNVYSSLIQGFLISDIEDCKYLLEMTKELDNQKERIEILGADSSYEIDRYCPHMGADLINCSVVSSKYIVCPRHGWKFDLSKKGKCKESNNATINSKEIEKS